MRILCLTSRLPYPPDRGDRLRAYHFLKHLAGEHELSLVSFVAGPGERRHIEPLRAFCQEVHVVEMRPWHSVLSSVRAAWRHEPLQVLYYRSRTMQHLVDRMRRERSYDLVYVHLFRMAPYVAGWRGVYRVLDLTDVISAEVARSLRYRSAASRLLYRMEQPRIERYERTAALLFDEAWLISEADRQMLARKCPGANLQVVPNGVDTDRFFPTDGPCQRDRLIFVGHLRVFHNVDAAVHLAQEILPRVRKQIPSCTLQIAGTDPSPRVQRLAAVPGVEVIGFVPDLNHVLNQASLFVAPLRFAAGVQNKVLEAMAAGRPVVTTSVVNAGLGACPDKEVLVGDDPQTIADHCVTLLRDDLLRSCLGLAGLRFVQRSYRWEKVADRVRSIQAGL